LKNFPYFALAIILDPAKKYKGATIIIESYNTIETVKNRFFWILMQFTRFVQFLNSMALP